MNSELQVILDDQKVAQDNAKQLIEAFGAPFTEAGDILRNYEDIKVTDVSQKDLMKEAKEKRLALKKIRTTVENKRKELKEDSLRTGKAIDSVAKYIKDVIAPAESYLELQEKFAELQEAKRVAALREDRLNKLSPYVENPSVYGLVDLTEDEFSTLLISMKDAFEMRIAKDEADKKQAALLEEQKAEEDRRIREENEKLKAELEKKHLEEEAKAIAEQKLQFAPDKDKLLKFVADLSNVTMPRMTTSKASDLAEQLTRHLETTLKMYSEKIDKEV